MEKEKERNSVKKEVEKREGREKEAEKRREKSEGTREETSTLHPGPDSR